MAAAVILMAILGCGDAGTDCDTVRISPVRYESVSACVAAQDDVLARADVMFPVVMAECRAAGSVKPASYEAKPVKAPVNKHPAKLALLRS